jgi:DNA-binding NarL/FixJ family response regulator
MEFGSRLTLHLRLLTPYLHEMVARVLMEESGGAIRTVRAGCRVTDRETEILRCIRDGKTNRDIATILGLSHYTVKNHVKKITKKMGVANRSHAVARAFSMGILSPSDTA